MMLLTEGRWTGRGRYLYHGQSVGIPVHTDFQVTSDDHGLHLEGSVHAEQQPTRQIALRVLPDDTGLFEMTAQGFGVGLQGTAKLSSEPNMGMMWADSLNRHVSFSVFAITQGYGCRGFMHDDSGLLTWELAMQKDTVGARRKTGQPAAGSNVVTLATRQGRSGGPK